jgi:hypothetical protein
MAGASLWLVLCLTAADGGAPKGTAHAALAHPAPAQAAPEHAGPVVTAVHLHKPGEAPAEPPAGPTIDMRPAARPALAATPAGSKAAAGVVGPVYDVTDGTTRLARALIARDIETLVQLTPAPFSFDGVVARSAAEVRQRWAEILDRHPVERLRLYDVQALGYDAAVQKYGKPPARLAGVSFGGSQIGIANLSGRATIVVWRKRSHGFTAVAVSD